MPAILFINNILSCLSSSIYFLKFCTSSLLNSSLFSSYSFTI